MILTLLLTVIKSFRQSFPEFVTRTRGLLLLGFLSQLQGRGHYMWDLGLGLGLTSEVEVEGASLFFTVSHARSGHVCGLSFNFID